MWQVLRDHWELSFPEALEEVTIEELAAALTCLNSLSDISSKETPSRMRLECVTCTATEATALL